MKAFDGAGGSVINIGTIASANRLPNTLLYSASKGAIDTITRELSSLPARANIFDPDMKPRATPPRA